MRTHPWQRTMHLMRRVRRRWQQQALINNTNASPRLPHTNHTDWYRMHHQQ